MTIDNLSDELERMESEGAVIVVKWDGERSKNRRTVVVIRADTNYTFRRDTDDIAAALRDAIEEYRGRFG